MSNRVTIRKKLIISYMAIALISISITTIVIALTENTRQKENTISTIEALTEIAGWNSMAALIFNDYEAALLTLEKATIYPEITSLQLFDANHNLFAQYPPAAPKTLSSESKRGVVNEAEQPHRLEISHKIIDRGNHIGTIVVSSELHGLREGTKQRFIRLLIMVVISSFLAWMLSRIVGGNFSRPIEELVNLMSRISKTQNFSIRGNEKQNSIDMQKVFIGFNNMLEGIEERDVELEYYRKGLQLQVEQRTQSLMITNETLEKTIKSLEEAKQRAEAANKAKSQFLATISHEIRTPLHGILGYCELMSEYDFSEQVKDYLTKIHLSGDILLQLINDLLDFEKIQSGKLELEKKVFSLKGLIEQTCSLYLDLAKKKNLELNLVTGDWPAEYFYADELRIRQILHNLVNNAIKFTNQGSITITNQVVHSINNDVYCITISVKDSGIGVPQKIQKDIFLPFSQADGTITRKYGGSGLGLSISKELVEMMGGEIFFESKKGVGSTFTFKLELPRAEPSKPLTPYNLVQVLDNTKPAPLADSLSVLVAEDNILNQEVLASILRQLGCSVDTVFNGKEVLQVLKNQKYDVILMDYHMPELDGISAACEIRGSNKVWSQIPIFAITGDVSKDIMSRCQNAGINGYLSKPFTKEDIIDILQKCRISD